jgi:hypothetical protein
MYSKDDTDTAIYNINTKQHAKKWFSCHKVSLIHSSLATKQAVYYNMELGTTAPNADDETSSKPSLV